MFGNTLRVKSLGSCVKLWGGSVRFTDFSHLCYRYFLFSFMVHNVDSRWSAALSVLYPARVCHGVSGSKKAQLHFSVADVEMYPEKWRFYSYLNGNYIFFLKQGTSMCLQQPNISITIMGTEQSKFPAASTGVARSQHIWKLGSSFLPCLPTSVSNQDVWCFLTLFLLNSLLRSLPLTCWKAFSTPQSPAEALGYKRLQSRRSHVKS